MLVKTDRLHPLIPRHTKRSRALYSRRDAVERESVGSSTNGRSCRCARGIERVRLHADLTILPKLACALAQTRAVPLAA